MERAFQVDLRGVVDLLSHHLYTGPRVYVRELLQNAVDAISARRLSEPDAPATVSIEPADGPGGGVLRVHDSGVGLTEPEVHELLATIGRSSKRDDLGFARHEFLGQFGIGLLSCFLVADEVRVLSRSARGGPTVAWTGYADGRYAVRPAETPRAEPGTTVTLVPRPGMETWLGTAAITDLATRFGELLPVAVDVAGHPVTGTPPPWEARYASPAARAAALRQYAEKTFGFAPFDVIDLHVPEAGLSGLAFVLPMSANPAERAGHRVYLRRMLLADGVDKLLPDWAFFVRCVVDTGELRPRPAARSCTTTTCWPTPATRSARRSATGSYGWPPPTRRGCGGSWPFTTSASRRWPCTTTRCCAWSTSGGRWRPTRAR